MVNPWWVRKKAKIKATRPTDQVIAYFNAAGCKPDTTPLDDGSGRRGQSAMPCSEANGTSAGSCTPARPGSSPAASGRGGTVRR